MPHPLCFEGMTYNPIDPITGELIDCGEDWYDSPTPGDQEQQWMGWALRNPEEIWEYDDAGDKIIGSRMSPAASYSDDPYNKDNWWDNILTPQATNWHEPFVHVIGYIALFTLWRLLK